MIIPKSFNAYSQASTPNGFIGELPLLSIPISPFVIYIHSYGHCFQNIPRYLHGGPFCVRMFEANDFHLQVWNNADSWING